VRSGVSVLLVVAVPIVGLVACADVRDRVERVVDQAADTAQDRTEAVTAGAADALDRTRFCFDLARAASAIEGGSPDPAADTAQELLAQAPEELRADAAWLAERLRGSDAEVARALEDPEVRATVERLRDRSRELCHPGAAPPAG
jgi:hypothetical protein